MSKVSNHLKIPFEIRKNLLSDAIREKYEEITSKNSFKIY
jgi:hypothetical protein